jgi:hypothetical protein
VDDAVAAVGAAVLVDAVDDAAAAGVVEAAPGAEHNSSEPEEPVTVHDHVEPNQ